MPGPIDASSALPPAAPVPGAAPTTAGQIGGGLVAAGSNMMLGTALGPEIPGITLGINAFVEWLKNKPWWREEEWTFPAVAVLCGAIGFVWHVLTHDDLKAVANAFALLGNSHLTYHGLKATGTGVLQPTAAENKWQAPEVLPSGEH